MSAPKLTAAQWHALKELELSGCEGVIRPNASTALNSLVRKGLATKAPEMRFNGQIQAQARFCITNAGRAALAQHEESK